MICSQFMKAHIKIAQREGVHFGNMPLSLLSKIFVRRYMQCACDKYAESPLDYGETIQSTWKHNIT